MTDTQTPIPIVVNANPGQDQAEAAVRQVLLALGVIVAAFGAAKWSGTLNMLASLAGPIVTVLFGVVGIGAAIWGQIKTREVAKKGAAMANLLPDSLAVAK